MTQSWPIHAVMRAAALAAAIGLAGCGDYLARRDALSPYAGHAQRMNSIVHAAGTVPEVAARRDLRFDGERMSGAVERYRSRTRTEAGSEAQSEAAGAGSSPTGIGAQ